MHGTCLPEVSVRRAACSSGVQNAGLCKNWPPGRSEVLSANHPGSDPVLACEKCSASPVKRGPEVKAKAFPPLLTESTILWRAECVRG